MPILCSSHQSKICEIAAMSRGLEAYLDVTANKTGLSTATQVARTIREQIRQELNQTASAGVAPNKFLAKLASDWRKVCPQNCTVSMLYCPISALVSDSN
jgi:nucleotidyltransferase/DNA polymerase involved in DNA repair